MKREWFANEPHSSLRVTQVYGFCVDHLSADANVLLLDDGGNLTLPGGKPEVADANWVETLRREAMEEASILLAVPRLLGYLRVSQPGREPFAQIRYMAQVQELRQPAVDPATGRLYRREWVPIERVAGLLNWGAHGHAQVATLLQHLRQGT